MTDRQRFEMTADDLAELMAACRPATYIVAGGLEPTSPQEKANRAWQRLGERLGFQWDTVQPVPGEGARVFTAVPLFREDPP